ncbi:MAG: amidohydrolase [Acidimicrobiia bacterium]|nr:amidohydrolase [Acidimicrobiia bacterium]
MAYPTDIPIIETFVGMPSRNRKEMYKFLAPHLRDQESKDFRFPAQYMFKDVPPDTDEGVDPVALLVDNLDRFNIETAMLGYNPDNPDCLRALTEHPRRFITCLEFDPTDVMPGIERIRRVHAEVGLKAISTFPAGYRTPIDDPKMYPFYALACELDLPLFCCVGIPGPRVPFAPQHVELVDRVMYDFPDLTFVMRHGAEPWTELAMKLMLKWPNLHYSTSAFAPKHYPKAIIDYANSRGADKVMYAGYFPAGLSYDRIFTDMADVPFKPEVWPKFLRENAKRVLKL